MEVLNTSRSSLDPKAPEFRTSLQQRFLSADPSMEQEATDVSPKRGSGRFALSIRSTVRPGDSFLNNFTGLFRRETKIGEDDDNNNDLVRPKSQDTQASGEPTTTLTTTIGGASVEDLPSEITTTTPEKKRKEKKKKDKSKGKSIFRWESKTDSIDEPELTSSKSLESMKTAEEENHENGAVEIPNSKKKKKRGKKGVKFEKEEQPQQRQSPAARTSTSQDGGGGSGPYYYEGREVTLEEVPVKVLDYFK